MQTRKPLFLVVRYWKRIWLVLALTGFLLPLVSCGDNLDEEPIITVDIENGQFEVDAVLLPSSGSNAQGPLGSGSLSFTFKGDLSGTFKVSGSLSSNQTANEGVGALVGPYESNDVKGEGFSFLGFRPTGNGKADIFLVGMRQDIPPLSSITPGNYGIGPFGRFLGIYVIGVDIDEFWKAQTTQTDLIPVSERAYVMSEGILKIAVRDSTRLVGTFSGQAAKQVNLAKARYMLNSIMGL
jgi:hypothetical protein